MQRPTPPGPLHDILNWPRLSACRCGVHTHTHLAVSQTTTTIHSGELDHALSQGYHISMEHRLRKKHLQLNSDTPASKETFLKEIEEKKKKHFSKKNREVEKHDSGVTFELAIPYLTPCPPRPKTLIFTRKTLFCTIRTSRRFHANFGVCSDD